MVSIYKQTINHHLNSQFLGLLSLLNLNYPLPMLLKQSHKIYDIFRSFSRTLACYSGTSLKVHNAFGQQLHSNVWKQNCRNANKSNIISNLTQLHRNIYEVYALVNNQTFMNGQKSSTNRSSMDSQWTLN